MKNIRVYADTSVFGGIVDFEFHRASRQFFRQIKNGQFTLVTSAIVEAEIQPAPHEVVRLFHEMSSMSEIIHVTDDALSLREIYLKQRIVSSKYADDALHVALATVARCSVIVSWNFKHIVHFDKIALYNAVNVSKGYKQIAIFSPLEVMNYE